MKLVNIIGTLAVASMWVGLFAFIYLLLMSNLLKDTISGILYCVLVMMMTLTVAILSIKIMDDVIKDIRPILLNNA